MLIKKVAPIKWPEPKTELSKRLQLVLPKISCKEIGQKIKRSDPTIRRYLSGKREVIASDVEKLAELSGCDPGWLLTGKKQMGEQQTQGKHERDNLRAHVALSNAIQEIVRIHRDLHAHPDRQENWIKFLERLQKQLRAGNLEIAPRNSADKAG